MSSFYSHFPLCDSSYCSLTLFRGEAARLVWSARDKDTTLNCLHRTTKLYHMTHKVTRGSAGASRVGLHHSTSMNNRQRLDLKPLQLALWHHVAPVLPRHTPAFVWKTKKTKKKRFKSIDMTSGDAFFFSSLASSSTPPPVLTSPFYFSPTASTVLCLPPLPP